MAKFAEGLLPVPSNVPEKKTPLAEKARQYRELKQVHDNLKADLDYLADDILSHFPEEPGSHDCLIDDNLRIVVSIQERWSWDERKLQEIASDKDAMPDCVKEKLVVDKRKFQRLSEQEQDEYLDALTRKPGSATIKVFDIDGEAR